MRVLVMHGGHGCSSGCCGHTIEIHDDAGQKVEERFEFDHPKPTYDRTGARVSRESHIDFAKRIVEREFGAEHVADLDWASCEVSDE